MARARRDRLKYFLAQNREELLSVVAGIENIDFAPAAGMKTYRAQLAEIAAMERESVEFLSTGRVPDWKELEASIKGTTLSELLAELAGIRVELFQVLDGLSDAQLEEAIPVPEEWSSFVGDSTLEREELFYWLVRHEYYHIGQIVTYRWTEGFNPYRSSSPS